MSKLPFLFLTLFTILLVINAKNFTFNNVPIHSHLWVNDRFLSVQFNITTIGLDFDPKNFLYPPPLPQSNRTDNGELTLSFTGMRFETDVKGFAYVSAESKLYDAYPGFVWDITIPSTYTATTYNVTIPNFNIREAMRPYYQVWTSPPKYITIDIVLPLDHVKSIDIASTKYQFSYKQRVENDERNDDYFTWSTPLLWRPISSSFSSSDSTKLDVLRPYLKEMYRSETTYGKFVMGIEDTSYGGYSEKYSNAEITLNMLQATRMFEIRENPSITYRDTCKLSAKPKIDNFFWSAQMRSDGLYIRQGSFDAWPDKLTITCEKFGAYVKPTTIYYTNGIDGPKYILSPDSSSTTSYSLVDGRTTQILPSTIPLKTDMAGFLRYTFLNNRALPLAVTKVSSAKSWYYAELTTRIASSNDDGGDSSGGKKNPTKIYVPTIVVVAFVVFFIVTIQHWRRIKKQRLQRQMDMNAASVANTVTVSVTTAQQPNLPPASPISPNGGYQPQYPQQPQYQQQPGYVPPMQPQYQTYQSNPYEQQQPPQQQQYPPQQPYPPQSPQPYQYQQPAQPYQYQQQPPPQQQPYAQQNLFTSTNTTSPNQHLIDSSAPSEKDLPPQY